MNVLVSSASPKSVPLDRTLACPSIVMTDVTTLEPQVDMTSILEETNGLETRTTDPDIR